MDKFHDDSICIYDFKSLKKDKIKNNKIKNYKIYSYISKGNNIYNAHPPPTNKLDPRFRGFGIP